MHYSRSHNTGLVKWHAILILLLVGFAAVYVWQLNSEAGHTFSIRDLEARRTELAGEIRDLNLQLSQARSLAAVARRAERLALQAPQEVTYVHLGFSTVAAYGSPLSP
ncbi:MAG: hypothetical protein HYT31_03155 [Parcubacteria group bacterium]|nr:hypothetical protein [Parcubacteria group bacterium]